MNIFSVPAARTAFRSVAFLEAGISECVETFVRWQEQIDRGSPAQIRAIPVHGDIPTLVRTLAPMTSGVTRRYLFIATKTRWTAFFDNGHHGTDGAAPAYLARIVPCRSVHARLFRTDDNGGFPATIFELFGPEQTEWLNVIRSISAISDDGRWQFNETGHVQAFEDIARYKERRIADRFTPEMLEKYLIALGIDAFDEAFYGADEASGVLVDIDCALPPGAREFAMEE